LQADGTEKMQGGKQINVAVDSQNWLSQDRAGFLRILFRTNQAFTVLSFSRTDKTKTVPFGYQLSACAIHIYQKM